MTPLSERSRFESADNLSQKRVLFSDEERASRAVGRMLETDEYEVFATGKVRLSTATVRDFLGLEDYTEERLKRIVYPSPMLSRSATISEAARLMHDFRLRAAPIEIEDRLVQVVTARAVIQSALARRAERGVSAEEVMTSDVIKIDADEPAQTAVRLMQSQSFDHLPVMKEGRVVGVVRSEDLLARMPPEAGIPSGFRGVPEKRFDYPVAKLIREEVVSLSAKSSYLEVLTESTARLSSYVLLMEGEEIVGISTLRDMMKPLVKQSGVEVPYSVAGLSGTAFDEAMVKAKVEKMGSALRQVYPDIEEVRAIVKGGRNKRHEVTLTIYTPTGLRSFTSEGRDVSGILDAIHPKVKRFMSSRRSHVEEGRERARRERGPV